MPRTTELGTPNRRDAERARGTGLERRIGGRLRRGLPAAIAVALVAVPAEAATYYVAPTASSDANPGTEAQPFASVAKAQSVATAGDRVWIRGGTYSFTSGT